MALCNFSEDMIGLSRGSINVAEMILARDGVDFVSPRVDLGLLSVVTRVTADLL